MKANQVSNFPEKDLQTEMENIYRILNQISFGTLFSERSENMDMFLVEVTASSTANDDNNITHDLKRVPIGYIVLSQSASGDFLAGTGADSETSIFIKCTTASTRFKVAIL